MFDFLTSGQIKEDAALLKKFTELTISKYAYLPIEQVMKDIQSDFKNEYTQVGDDFIKFHYPELTNFYFTYDHMKDKVFGRGLVVQGGNIYEGFILQVNRVDSKERAKWQVMYEHHPMYHATGKAVKLAKYMSKKYDIENYTDVEKSMGFSGY